jgi:hypothetical protein
MGGNNKMSKIKYATFSKRHWSLNQHCKEYLSWWLAIVSLTKVSCVSICREMSRFCEGIWGPLENNPLFWMSHASPTRHTPIWIFVLTNKTFAFWAQRIQSLMLPTNCIQRITVWGALPSIGICGPTFIDGTLTSEVCFGLLGNEFALPWCNVALQWTKPGAKRMVFCNASNLQNPPYVTFETSMYSIPLRQCCQYPNAVSPFMPASIRSTLQYK